MASYVRVDNFIMKIEIRMVDGSAESRRWVDAAREEAQIRYRDMMVDRPAGWSYNRRRERDWGFRRRMSCWWEIIFYGGVPRLAQTITYWQYRRKNRWEDKVAVYEW
ncbi:unnamed protein product [Gordionus sp. m RMFG-2023]